MDTPHPLTFIRNLLNQVLMEDMVVVLHGDDFDFGIGDYERCVRACVGLPVCVCVCVCAVVVFVPMR